MKLREFTDEDITEYALTHGGRNIRNMFVEVNSKYERIKTDIKTISKHPVIVNDIKNSIDDLISDIVDLHNSCLKCEDDHETRSVATALKSMFQDLPETFDSM